MADPIHHTLSHRIEQILLPILSTTSERICIIDPPGHPNVGDSAILLGELDFIARHFPAAELSYYDVDSYTPAADRFIEDATVLLIHGGGNFGDIWPHHHRLRLRILDRFPHKAVLQMPQSIHFDDDRERRTTAAVIARHRNFTLAVRDQNSFDSARQHFDCNVVLCPDMAFAINPIIRRQPTVEYFCLLRTDKEAVIAREEVQVALNEMNCSFEVADWLNEQPNMTVQLDNRLRWLTSKLPAITAPFRSKAMRLRQRYALQRLTVGIKLLSSGSTVVTDRLHAHILCCLLNIPHYVFDSYDGKISAFHSTWTSEYKDAQMIASVAQLTTLLRSTPR